jgi:hypothetical protein
MCSRSPWLVCFPGKGRVSRFHKQRVIVRVKRAETVAGRRRHRPPAAAVIALAHVDDSESHRMPRIVHEFRIAEQIQPTSEPSIL